MKTNYLTVVIGLFLALGTNQLNATHNRAGEITYRQLSSTTIEATITTYTKRSSRPADRDSLTLCWGDGTCQQVARSNGNGEDLVGDYKLNQYIATHEYDSAGTYILSMTDPNRNGGIENINFPNSEQVNFHIQTTFVLLEDGAPNGSPVFLEMPTDIGYVGKVFTHTPNVFDFEGDSISYEFSVPLSGIANPVLNYQFPDQINPGTENTLTIDPNTGMVTWDAPQREGEYTIAILIKTFREGVLVDQMIRDMQILVERGDNSNPGIQVTNGISTNEVEQRSLGDTVRVDLLYTDTDFDQTITLSSSSGLYLDFFENPATFSSEVNGGTGNASFEWIVREEHLREQPYAIAFGVQDDFQDSIGLASYIVVRFKVTDQMTNVQDIGAEALDFNVFPNPVNGQNITVQIPWESINQNFQIFDSSGRLIKKGRLNQATQEIDVEDLEAGKFIIQIRIGEVLKAKSFIKTK